MQSKLYLPKLDAYKSHLVMFGDQYALSSLWEILELINEKGQTTEYLEELKERWESLTVEITKTLHDEALLEVNQIMQFANPIALENLHNAVIEFQSEVEQVLSEENIRDQVLQFNRVPPQRLRKLTSDETSWTISNEKWILNPDYVDDYMDSVINLYLLPDFTTLANRVLMLFDVNSRGRNLFNHSIDSLETHIENKEIYNNVIEQLVKGKYVRQDETGLYWLGIGRSKLGSLAALARYLEEAKIVRRFNIMYTAQKEYSKNFNVQLGDKKEWNKNYDLQNFRFDDATVPYSNELGFILKE